MAKDRMIEQSLSALSKNELISIIVSLADMNKDNKKTVEKKLLREQDNSPLHVYEKKISSAVDSLSKSEPKIFSTLRTLIKEFRTVSKDKNHSAVLMFFCLEKSIAFVKKQRSCNEEFFHALADFFNQTLEFSEKNRLMKKYTKNFESILGAAKKADSDLYEELTSLYCDYIDA